MATKSKTRQVQLHFLLPGQVYTKDFPTATTVEEVFISVKSHLDGKHACTDMFLPTYGIWLKPNRPLGSYHLQAIERVEFTKRPKKHMKQISIVLPSGDVEQVEYYKRTTGRGILLSVEDKPSTFSLDIAACFLPAKQSSPSQWIESSLPLSFYELKSDTILIYGERQQRKTSTPQRSRIPRRSQTMTVENGSMNPTIKKPSVVLQSPKRIEKCSTSENIVQPEAFQILTRTSSETSSETSCIFGEEVEVAGLLSARESSYSYEECAEAKPVLRNQKRRRSNSNPDEIGTIDMTKIPQARRDKKVKSLTRVLNSKTKIEPLKSVTLSVIVGIAEQCLEVTITEDGKKTLKSIIPLVLEAAKIVADSDSSLYCFQSPLCQNNLSMDLQLGKLASTNLILTQEKTPLKKSSNSTRKKSTSKLLKTLRVSKSKGAQVFKQPDEIPANEIDIRVVTNLIHWLTVQEAAKEEGIFRISASSTGVVEILTRMIKDPRENFLKYSETNHDVAGALKTYFRKVKVPIFPYEYYEDIMNSYQDRDISLEIIKGIVAKLDSKTRHTLGILFSYLHSVQALEHLNFMGADNLGVVFGPTLLRDPSDSIDISRMCYSANIVGAIIMNYKKIFSDEETVLPELDISSDDFDESLKNHLHYESTIQEVLSLTSTGDPKQITAGLSVLSNAITDSKCLDFMMSNTSKEQILELLVASLKQIGTKK